MQIILKAMARIKLLGFMIKTNIYKITHPIGLKLSHVPWFKIFKATFGAMVEITLATLIAVLTGMVISLYELIFNGKQPQTPIPMWIIIISCLVSLIAMTVMNITSLQGTAIQVKISNEIKQAKNQMNNMYQKDKWQYLSNRNK